MISEKQTVDFLKSKDKDYIDKLIASLDHYDTSANNSCYSACPICGSVHIKKNGRDKYGHQRYFCKDCYRSFNDRTHTLIYWPHLTLEQWKQFIDLEISKMTFAA